MGDFDAPVLILCDDDNFIMSWIYPNNQANRDTRRVSQFAPFDGCRVIGNPRIAIHAVKKIPENGVEYAAKLPTVVF